MTIHGSLSTYVARCPVQLYEAAGSRCSWVPKGPAGEFRMKSLGNAVLFLQLWSLSNKELLFEHTMQQPDSLIILSPRFFVIQLKNGSFQGFGFDDSVAASEMKEHVSKAIKPHGVEEHTNQKPVVKDEEERELIIPSLDFTHYRQNITFNKWNLSWKRLTSFSYMRHWNPIAKAYGCQEREIKIGYPTDVKHVAHIGWDGQSVEELQPSLNRAREPAMDFGQAKGSNRIHDTLLSVKCMSIGKKKQVGPPPTPPPMYSDSSVVSSQKKCSWWKIPWPLQKLRDYSAAKVQSLQT